jgi:Predicted redox protein, regulator of disulfide bond formation
MIILGLKCPLPVLKAKRVIKNIDFNEEHIFICDDPASPIDFKHLCNNEGLKLDITNKSDGKFTFKIMKK